MNYFHRPDGGFHPPVSLDDAPVSPDDPPACTDDPPVSTEDPPRSPFAQVAGRFATWITGADRMVDPEPPFGDESDRDPFGRLTDPPSRSPEAPEEPARFPVAPLGYNRAAVDEHLLALERELAELRGKHEPVLSITEELERIGEQTASILVVAHDQAHETTRLAQKQADRCVSDAAANAVAITLQAKDRLAELDGETDSVWRERERLLQDVRVVSAQLTSLADEAAARFPAAEPATGAQATVAFAMPMDAIDGPTDRDHRPPGSASPGDTGTWLAGL
jgi:cell division septum initiation protein DivIVA